MLPQRKKPQKNLKNTGHVSCTFLLHRFFLCFGGNKMKNSSWLVVRGLFFILLAGCACPDGKRFTDLEPARLAELKASLANISDEEFNELLNASDFAREFLPKQVIVKFSSEASTSQVRETLRTLSASTRYRFKSSNALLIDIPDAPTRSDIIAIVTALNEVKSIEYAVPNGILRLTQWPNDPQLGELDNLRNQGQGNGTVGADIRAEQAWQITTGSKNVVVGVIDTGIDYLHPDLAENMWRNPGETGVDEDGFDKATNGVDDDGNGFVDDVFGWDFVNNDNDPMDDYGHGTHVAGTIGAVGNNGFGIAGVAWNVSLVAIKIFDENGGSSNADIIRAIDYATANRIPITNNSWGGMGFNQAMKDAIEANARAGSVFIAAAGNDGVDNDQIKFYPASYGVENIISVGAMTNKDEKTRFSNFGSHTVHIGAPGENILSLAMSHTGQLFTRMSGTSMAAPHVSGAAALIKSAFPNSTAQEIRSRILYGADQIPQLLSAQWTFNWHRPDKYPVDKPLFQGGRRLNLARSLETDTEAPSGIQNLKLNFFGLTSIGVIFQGAGDDNQSGKAAGYIAAITEAPLTQSSQWSNAQKLDLSYVEEDSSGLIKSEIVGLEPFQKGYLTIRAVDNAGNLGPQSPSLHFEMSRPTVVYQNDGETDEGMNFVNFGSLTFRPFLREVVAGRGQVWSDSPGGPRDYASAYMEFPEVTITHSDTVFQFQTKLDCDLVYERGEIEYLLNNETDPGGSIVTFIPGQGTVSVPAPFWKRLSAYSASQCDWGQVNISLRNKVKAGDKIRVRFKFRGMRTIDPNRDGWLVDDVKFLAPGTPEVPTGLKAIKPDYHSSYRLLWQDNSEGETRFEIKRGESIVAETAVNEAYFETGLNQIENEWQVRACNGSACSSWSEGMQILAAPPLLQSISPSAGRLAGGTLLRLRGLGFNGRNTVRVGGLPCGNLSFISSQELTCLTPPHLASAHTVTVFDENAQMSQIAGAYRYQAAPTVSSVNINLGGISGGKWITVTGTGFLEGVQGFLGNQACVSTTRLNSNQIRCLTPPLSAGHHSIVVKNTDEQDSSANLLVRFRAVAPYWIATQGGVCSQVCKSFKMVSVPSPEGAFCTSGEVIPVSAKRGAILYQSGCWPFRDCRAQGFVSGARSFGKFCYGPGQRQDKGRTDTTMGCYCSY